MHEQIKIPKVESIGFLRLPKVGLMEFLRLTQYAADKKTVATFTIKENMLECALIDPALEIDYKIRIPDMSIQNSIFGLNPVKLHDFLRKLEIKEGDVKFLVQKNSVSIQHELGKGEIAKIEIDERIGFMAMDNGPVSSYSMEAGIFIEALRVLKNCIGADTGREQFSGLNMEFDAEQLKMWATDGHVLCLSAIKTSGQPHSCILPKRFVDCISSLTPESACELELYTTCVVYKQQNFRLISPLINANVLPVKKLFDRKSAPTLEMEGNAMELCKQIERVMIFSDQLRLVSLSYEGDMGRISTVGNTGDNAEEGVQHFTFKGEGAGKLLIGAQQLVFILKNFKSSVLMQYYAEKGNVTLTKRGEEFPVYVIAVRKS